jgi:hypothetical protein
MLRARSPARSIRSAADEEAGTGLVGTLAGFAAVVLFLLLATQVLVHLYATSAVTAAAYDAARIVSGSDGGPASQDEAVAHAQGLLGRWSDQVLLEFTRTDGEQVVLRVTGQSPALLPRALNHLTGVGGIEREIVVRTERFRD